MTKYAFLLIALCFLSCSKEESNNNEPNNPGNSENITARKPCFDGSFSLNLPAKLADQNNYIQYEATTELVSTIIATEALLNGVSSLFFNIPENAINATIDDINVSSSDNALEWTIGEEKYIYLEKSDGYSIKYLENKSDILANEIINVTQNEDCTSFDYYQYAEKDDGDVKQGDLVFYLVYDKAGTADILEYGTNLEDPESETVRIRKFEDNSGSMRLKNKATSENNRLYQWASDGSGSWEKYENGVVVEAGTWSF